MSVLFVEGKLDAQLLGAVLVGGPTIIRGGPKYDLPKRALEERRPGARVSYIRDRDFDFDPPVDRSRPQDNLKTKDSAGAAVGYYWCRHEIENYLLEPAIVCRATTCDGPATGPH